MTIKPRRATAPAKREGDDAACAKNNSRGAERRQAAANAAFREARMNRRVGWIVLKKSVSDRLG